MSHEYDYDDEEIPVHGLRMTKEAFEDLVEHENPSFHYEMIDGIVYNMAPPSPEHDRIAFNIRRSLSDQIGDSGPCRVFQEQRVAIPGEASVRPDVFVTCDIADWSKKERVKRHHRFRSPLIVVEILSPSTQAFDRTGKFARYMLCATLQVYILVNQDKQHVEVYRRENNWEPEFFASGQTIKLDQLDLELPVDEIYTDIFQDTNNAKRFWSGDDRERLLFRLKSRAQLSTGRSDIVCGHVALQGNLDPATLLASPEEVYQRTLDLLSEVGGRPGHILSLGHGVLKETDPASVAAFVAAARDFRAGEERINDQASLER